MPTPHLLYARSSLEWQDPNTSQYLCVLYLDDVILFDAARHDHLANIQYMMTILKRYGIFLDIKKCCFAKGQIAINPNRTTTIETLPRYIRMTIKMTITTL